MTDKRDILVRLQQWAPWPGATASGTLNLIRDAIAAIEQRDQTIANLLDEKRRAMADAKVSDSSPEEARVMTTSPDILDRLRGLNRLGGLGHSTHATISAAISEIAAQRAEIERLCGLLGIKQARTPGGFYPIEEAPQPERWEIRRDAVDIVEGAWVPVEGEPLGITHGYYRMPMAWFRRRMTP